MTAGAVAPTPIVAVVIPSFRATRTIGAVLRQIGPEVARIYVVDDGCPDKTGEAAATGHSDPRLTVLHNKRNRGVGGAMKHGYKRALADGADIIVKIDADGQMDPSHIPVLIAPILCAGADYTKGNRFAPASRMPNGSCPRAIRLMPWRRRIANAALSAFHRAATGYWRIGDPANGYTAIRADALRQLGLDALEDCFFFETDMLYRLNLIGAAVKDVPLPAIYPGGPSTLSVRRVAPRFALLIADRWLRRVRARLFADSSRRSTAAAR